MEAEDLSEFFETKKDCIHYLTLSPINFTGGVQSWLNYFESTNIFLDSETKEILLSEYVSTNETKRIAVVPSSFPDGVDNEDICHENLKIFSEPTAEFICVAFEFLYNYFYKGKEYKYSPVFLLSKSGSSINAYMRLGKNTLTAFFFVDKRSS